LLEEKSWIKNIEFTRNDASSINKKIIKNFPVLKEYGWVCLKPTPNNQLIPFKTDETIDGDVLRR
jgi:hypothetical protein